MIMNYALHISYRKMYVHNINNNINLDYILTSNKTPWWSDGNIQVVMWSTQVK